MRVVINRSNFVRFVLSPLLVLPFGEIAAVETRLPGFEHREALTQRISAATVSEAQKAEVVKKGRELASVCAICHGIDGNSKHVDIPRLAAQNPIYLLEQLEKFADGRRNDYIMTPLAKRYSPEDRVAVAIYYANMPREAEDRSQFSPKLISRGKDLFNQVCRHCHGADGHGGEGYPYIAGQRSKYIMHRLIRFRERLGTSANSMMTDIAKNLSDSDIDALAAYVATLK